MQLLNDCFSDAVTSPTAARAALRQRFLEVRQASLQMCEPLAAEEFRIQPVAEVSPPWWNLGHTSWFFARNLLQPLGGEYTVQDQELDFVLNSYYVSLGDRVGRDVRGMLTRPTTEQIYSYRQSVDQRMLRLIESVSETRLEELASLLTIGIHHEQQHQELFYTEIKYIGAQVPLALRVAYCRPDRSEPDRPMSDLETSDLVLTKPPTDSSVRFDGGLFDFGNLDGGWGWDNELPVHKYYLCDFALTDRLVINGEYLEFIDDGGYANQLHWLDNGWRWKCQQGWKAPKYWERHDGQWRMWTLTGMRAMDPSEPVCHVSFYEADAFARWKRETYRAYRNARLPTERELEQATRVLDADPNGGNQLQTGLLHPAAAASDDRVKQLFGDVWEWTSSYYEPYAGYQPFAGNLAEYNGKFMDNQRVLRGGSCVSPPGHLRRSYRNFWSGETRFQFTGFRLCFTP
jgi:ergothioneine biosynthesis protein EgtB